jgi:hypothetical protein
LYQMVEQAEDVAGELAGASSVFVLAGIAKLD